MLANPIVRKEVLSALRTKKALVMQALFLLAAAGLLWLLWDPQGLQDLAGREARRILSIIAMGELVMVALFAPAFTAAAITGEKEHNTLESLLATRMRPGEIAFGKIAGSLTFVVLLVVSGIPALAAVFLLGGVDGSEVLAVVAVLMLTAIYLGMIGLLVSTIMNRSYRAIIVTYAVLGVICILFAMPAWPLSDHFIRKGGPVWQGVLHVLASLSPIQAMLSVVQPNSTYAVGAENMPPYWQVFLPASALVAVATTIACLYRLHRPAPPPRPREGLKIEERNFKVSGRKVLYLWFFDPRRRRAHIRWWQNPVLIKEFRTRPMLQPWWLMRAFAASLIAAVLLMFLVTFSFMALVQDTGGLIPLMATTVAALMVLAVALLGPAVSGGALCTDRETGVWELMRTTRLSGWTIVLGKLMACVIPMFLLALAMAPALILLLCFKKDLWPNIQRILTVVGMTILFVSSAGMFFSSLAGRTSTATAWTYGVVVSMAMATLLVLLAEEIFSPQFARMVYVLNPVAAAMDAAGYAPMQRLGLFADHLRIAGVATAGMLLVSVLRVMQLRRAA